MSTWKREPVDSPEALELRTRRFRLVLFRAMNSLSTDQPKEEWQKIRRAWQKYKRLVIELASGGLCEPGWAEDHFAREVYKANPWKRFREVSRFWRVQRPDYKARQCEHAKRWYDEVGKAHRAEPEVRDGINAKRRESYDPAKRRDRYLKVKAKRVNPSN